MTNLSPYTRPGQYEVLSLIGTRGQRIPLDAPGDRAGARTRGWATMPSASRCLRPIYSERTRHTPTPAAR